MAKQWAEPFTGARLPDGTLAPTEWTLNDDGELEDNWFELNNPPLPGTPEEHMANWAAIVEDFEQLKREEPDHPMVKMAARAREFKAPRIRFSLDPFMGNPTLPPNSIWRKPR